MIRGRCSVITNLGDQCKRDGERRRDDDRMMCSHHREQARRERVRAAAETGALRELIELADRIETAAFTAEGWKPTTAYRVAFVKLKAAVDAIAEGKCPRKAAREAAGWPS